MAHTVAICSLKGGVGKTSVTLGLASAAVEFGIRTTVMDLDPQADTTLSLGLPISSTAHSVRELLRDPSPATFTAWSQPSHWESDALNVLPGNTALLESDYRHPQADEARDLYRMLHPETVNTQSPDLVLIDCPPSLGSLTIRGLLMSDRALIVTEPGLFAVNAVSRALNAVNDLRQTMAPHLQPLGIVVNRNKPRGVEQRFRIEELKRIFGPLILSPVLDERAALQQAQGAGSRIHDWPGAGARELESGFDAIMGRILRSGNLI